MELKYEKINRVLNLSKLIEISLMALLYWRKEIDKRTAYIKANIYFEMQDQSLIQW